MPLRYLNEKLFQFEPEPLADEENVNASVIQVVDIEAENCRAQEREKRKQRATDAKNAYLQSSYVQVLSK